MAASKQNFFQAHWDWLVAGGGVLALVGAGVFLMSAMGTAPDAAAASYEASLNVMKPAREGVAPADLTVLQTATRLMKTPPALRAVEAKKANFLASERRVFCQKGDAAEKKEACGRPIPDGLEVCPFCQVKQHLVKVEVDSDNDGLPNDWEKKYALNPNDAADAVLDADGDAFTNTEEFKAGTNPRDPASHPDYLDSLAVAGALNQTFLPFWFKSYTPIPGGYRFMLQKLDKSGQDVRGYGAVYSVKKDEAIGTTGFTVTAFEKKTETQKIAGSKAGLTKTVDASVLTLVRKSDGKTMKAVIAVRKNPIEAQTELAYERGQNSWKKTVSVGAEIDLSGEKYRVISLREAEKGCEVTVENLKTKKQKVVR